MALPSGTVTFLFSDVEGSTKLWAGDASRMSASLRVHDAVLREAIGSCSGYVFTTAGDSFAAAFSRASDAVEAARLIQDELLSRDWPGPVLRVRVGLHMGEAEERDGDYFGPVVNLASRVEAAGHGGQVLLTETVRASADVAAKDLGEHQLRDVRGRVRLFQLGDKEFAPLRVVRDDLVRLPHPATTLVGREDEVRRVRTLLLDHRLVTLTGVGGSGKTRLAIEVGERELPTMDDGVYFADLSAVTSSEDVARTAGSAIGLQLEDDDPLDRVRGFLAARRALLILDNCEHVVEAAAELAETTLASPGQGRIIATSRESLEVDGEQVYQVPSLDATGPRTPAVRLFVDRASATGMSVVNDDSTLETVARLCQQLDGMPLAIELAAARATVLSPQQLVERIGDRFALLSGGRRRSRQRQRTLEATIDWSYDLLTPHEQGAFRRCGVFDADFDLLAAGHVAALGETASLDMLDSLTSKSLVVPVVTPLGVRYRLLESLKAYAVDKLIANEELEDARDRHADHYATRWDVVERNDEANVGLPQMLADRGNLNDALDWAHARQNTALINRLLANVGWLDVLQNDFEAFKQRYAELEVPDDDIHGQWTHSMAAAAANATMNPRQALTLDRPALTSTHPGVRSAALVMRAMNLSATDPSQTQRLVDRAQTVTGLTPTQQAWVHTASGIALSRTGDLERADEEFRRSADLLHDHPTPIIEAHNHVGIAALHLLAQRPQASIHALDQLLFQTTAMSVPVLRAIAYAQLAQLDKATNLLTAASEEAFLGRVPYFSCSVLIGFAGLALATNQPDRARRLLRSVKGLGFTGHTAYWLNTADQLGCGPEVRNLDHRPRPEHEVAKLLESELAQWGFQHATTPPEGLPTDRP